MLMANLLNSTQCNQTFKSRQAFTVHHKVTHGSIPKDCEDVEIFQCEQCTKAFWEKRLLKAHIKLRHSGEPLKCTKCEETFSTKYRLNLHVRETHLKMKLLTCEEPGCENRRFPSIGRLQTHILNMHKRVTCEECGKEICNSFTLGKHMFSVHGIKPKDAIQCQFCDAFFRLEITLQNHIEKHHT